MTLVMNIKLGEKKKGNIKLARLDRPSIGWILLDQKLIFSPFFCLVLLMGIGLAFKNGISQLRSFFFSLFSPQIYEVFLSNGKHSTCLIPIHSNIMEKIVEIQCLNLLPCLLVFSQHCIHN